MDINDLKKASKYIDNNIPKELHIIKNVLDEKIDKEIKNEINRKLNQYKNMKREITELREKYNVLNARATKITSSSDGMPHATGTSDKTGNAANMAELMMQIESNIKIVENNILDIERFVLDIEDVEIREIIRYRFIDGLSWQQVAFKMDGYNEATPRSKYQRWLKRI